VVKYQDLKAREVTRLLVLCAVLGVSIKVGFWAGGYLKDLLGDLVTNFTWGIVIMEAPFLATALWGLSSCPAQDALVFRWAELRLGLKAPPEFDWTLIDETDPDYRTSTWTYMRRQRRGG
jgi:hypothetical protein